MAIICISGFKYKAFLDISIFNFLNWINELVLVEIDDFLRSRQMRTDADEFSEWKNRGSK